MGLIGDEVKWCRLFFIFLPLAWLGSSKAAVPAGAARVGYAGKRRSKAIKIAPSSLSGLFWGSSSFLPLGSTEHEALATPAGAPETAVKASPRLARISKNQASPACFLGLGKLLFLRAGGGLTFGERCSCDGWEQGQILGEKEDAP